MLRVCLAAFLAGAAPAAAFDVTAMTEAERDAFGAAVRDYLVENPAVLREMVAALEAEEATAQAEADERIIAENADALFRNPDDWVGGNPDGAITLVEFLDYRCGYCKRAHPEVAALVEANDDIRLVVKEFPILGPQSTLASRFALAVKDVAGDDAYARVSDALMESDAPVSEPALKRLARDQGLDMGQVEAAMDSPAIDAHLNDTLELARALQIQGTPSFVLEDRMLRGYVPLPEMQAIIDDARDAS